MALQIINRDLKVDIMGFIINREVQALEEAFMEVDPHEYKV
jgi:hypothetical protein